MKSYQRNWA